MERTGSGKQVSWQEWETMIDDFQAGKESKWISHYTGLGILKLALQSIARRDFAAKAQLIVFMEENATILIGDEDVEEGMGALVDTLKAIVQAPADGAGVTYVLKEQMMVAATTVLIVMDGLHRALHHVEGLIELLLGVINRPNHGIDRQARSIACECLRQLEKAYPCLLYSHAGHFLTLCQSERTHAIQSYVLLLTTVLHSLACYMYKGGAPSSRNSGFGSSILSSSVPLVPFNVPSFLVDSLSREEITSIPSRELVPGILKEFRRVVAFLLERPQILTPFGMLVFVSHLIDVAEALQLQVSLLKVQFSGLIYSYNPLLCHLVLMICARFVDAFEGDGQNICRRLILISKEGSQPFIIRLLAIHWIMGLETLSVNRAKKSLVTSMTSSLYPSVFDPLSLKAAKLDALAYFAADLDSSLRKVCRQLDSELKREDNANHKISVKNFFNDGLVSLSSFRWLPPWATETRLAFRMIHRFMTVTTPHPVSNVTLVEAFMESELFITIQTLLISTALECQKLVPSLLALIDRLLSCNSHKSLGEWLLLILNGHVLSKLPPDHNLPAYFPLFNRIAQNSSIPPQGLLKLLTMYAAMLIKDFDPDTEFKSWSLASKVLKICRAVLMHHHSSRIFDCSSRLLALLSGYFPDLEIRDIARTYLRMLLSIPGGKLRYILQAGQTLQDGSSVPQLSSFLKTAPSPRAQTSFRHNSKLSTWIHLFRVTPLIVKQSWSIVMLSSGVNDINAEADTNAAASVAAATVEERKEVAYFLKDSAPDTLFVMDSKVSGILETLRMHFSTLPDFQNGPGLNVKVHCKLYFDSDKNPSAETDKQSALTIDDDSLPALYAIVIKFSGPAQYRRIPAVRIPFLVGKPRNDSKTELALNSEDQNKMLIEYPATKAVVVKSNHQQVRDDAKGFQRTPVDEEEDAFQESVMIEIEPKEPVPAFIDVHIEASNDDGENVRGQLQSIPVGIEDLFLRSPIPDDVPEDAVADYYGKLFNSLWEACESPANIGRETFPLKGGKKTIAIHATGSVKLLEARSEHVVDAVEHFLAPFVVVVCGESLINMVKERGYIKNVVWKNSDNDVSSNQEHNHSQDGPLRLKYVNDDKDDYDSLGFTNRNIGSFSILILLPPCFHLLLMMEVSELSTLVRIKTDHWPCLAYIDEYLEVLAIR